MKRRMKMGKITYFSYLFLCTVLVLYWVLGNEEKFEWTVITMLWLIGSIVYFGQDELKDD